MAKTVTLSEDLVSDIDRYRARLQNELNKPVSWERAFRQIMNDVVTAAEFETAAFLQSRRSVV
jgi:hypothetical protein